MLGKYKNGNYSVEIMEDGTKIRRTNDKSFLADFPECMDVKITDYCDLNCLYCHENSTINGKHGNILQASFIDTLQPFTELAIGGGNPISHPDIIPFLQKLKAKDVIANITVNQKHFNQYESLIRFLINDGLVKGLGISLTDSSDATFLEKASKIKNAVIHVINGLITLKDIKNLSCKSLKILILGYKQFQRGISFYSPEVEQNKNMLKKWLPRVAPMFKIVSFDNLALNQLCVKDQMRPEDWSRFYMGDDGMHTMYIDLVKNEFARCSIANIRYPLQNDIISMFDVVKKEK